jgi:hypothetical protein
VYTEIWWKNLKKRDLSVDLDLDGNNIKLDLKEIR